MSLHNVPFWTAPPRLHSLTLAHSAARLPRDLPCIYRVHSSLRPRHPSSPYRVSTKGEEVLVIASESGNVPGTPAALPGHKRPCSGLSQNRMTRRQGVWPSHRPLSAKNCVNLGALWDPWDREVLPFGAETVGDLALSGISRATTHSVQVNRYCPHPLGTLGVYLGTYPLPIVVRRWSSSSCWHCFLSFAFSIGPPNFQLLTLTDTGKHSCNVLRLVWQGAWLA